MNFLFFFTFSAHSETTKGCLTASAIGFVGIALSLVFKSFWLLVGIFALGFVI